MTRAWIMVALVACGGSETAAEPPMTKTCEAGEIPLADGCFRAGVPATGCSPGFVFDGVDGCTPELPPDPCLAGSMATPGETACRPVADCGTQPWGTIDTNGDTEFVDANFAGGDGSMSMPWQTIQDAVDAAAPGAVIAITDGSYQEDVSIDKAITLWGRCPERVEIVGTGAEIAAVLIAAANGAAVRSIAVRGPANGIVMSDSLDVVVDRLWAHDLAGRGVHGQTDASASLEVVDSLVENATEIGVFGSGTEVSVTRSLVRGTRAGAGELAGWGVVAEPGMNGTTPSSLTVTSSVIEHNGVFGVVVFGAPAHIEATVVRDTQPSATYDGGYAIGLYDTAVLSASLTLAGSVIQRNSDSAIVLGGDAVVERTTVVDTLPLADGHWGRGIDVEYNTESQRAPTVTVRESTIARNHEVGVFVAGSQATLEALSVRDMLTTLGEPMADAVYLRHEPQGDRPSHVDMKRCAVLRGRRSGIGIARSELVLDSSLVADNATQDDGLFGDGIVVMADAAPASATLTNDFIVGNVRAGIANFGGSVSLTGTTFDCNTIHLNGEGGFMDPVFTDEGGNRCTCNGEDVVCKSISAGLEPPAPPNPTDP